MKSNYKILGAATVAVMFAVSSCKKIEMEADSRPEYPVEENSIALRDATDVPMGVAISYTPMINNNGYSAVVKRDFDAVTFEYHMKHGAIVQDNGTLNFTNTDALVAAVGNLAIHGHTLAWHKNNNATYLKNFAGIVVPAATNLATNPGFESGLTGWSTFNTGNPAGTATITAGAGASEVRTGNGSMKVVNPTAYNTEQWRVQVSSSAFTTVPAKQYIISYWVKALSTGGSIRLSTGPSSAQYQGDQTIGTAWQQVSWTITANLTSTTFLFDMGRAANTYYIDDVMVSEVTTPPSTGQIGDKLDIALGDFITQTVNKYKSKVKSWDVVNELFDENGNIRNNSNTDATPSDVVVWSHYMGRGFGKKAFDYAKAADPTADLYINDYNLETNGRKLDSLIKYVAEIKAQGAKVDGIGTQMHISWNTGYAGIVSMFEKLAATGLKIRITELDVKVNTNGISNVNVSPEFKAYQADMYKFVIKTYLSKIPKTQQGGITIWGVSDNLSWLHSNGLEYPLLYDNEFKKKPAYTGILQALQAQ